MAEKISRGVFFAFEGPEGSGKSTQVELICKDLVFDGYDVCRTAEPGGTPLGGKIRDILLERDEINLGPIAELFLFEADRAQHIEEVIGPALSQKKIIICDRFNTATFAYQGYGLGVDMDIIRVADNAARSGILPDMTIILDMDVATGMGRAMSRGKADRMEKRETGFHDRVRQGYLELAAKEPDRIKVIDASAGIDTVHEAVKREVYGFIERHNRAE